MDKAFHLKLLSLLCDHSTHMPASASLNFQRNHSSFLYNAAGGISWPSPSRLNMMWNQAVQEHIALSLLLDLPFEANAPSDPEYMPCTVCVRGLIAISALLTFHG